MIQKHHWNTSFFSKKMGNFDFLMTMKTGTHILVIKRYGGNIDKIYTYICLCMYVCVLHTANGQSPLKLAQRLICVLTFSCIRIYCKTVVQCWKKCQLYKWVSIPSLRVKFPQPWQEEDFLVAEYVHVAYKASEILCTNCLFYPRQTRECPVDEFYCG